MQRTGSEIDTATGGIATASMVLVGAIVVLGGSGEMLLVDAICSRDAVWPIAAERFAMIATALDADANADADVDTAIPRASVANDFVGLGTADPEDVNAPWMFGLQRTAVSRLLLDLELSGMRN